MKILHLNQHGVCRGGVEGYIGDVIRALYADGHESKLVYFEAYEPGQFPAIDSGLSIHVSPDNWEQQLVLVTDEFQPDVVYVHAVYDPTIVRWIAELLPTIAYVHSPYLVCPGFGQYLKRSKKSCPYSAGPKCLILAQTERCCFGHNAARHLQRLRQVYDFIELYRKLPLLVGSEFMRELLMRNRIPVSKEALLAPVLFRDDGDKFWQFKDSTKILFVGRIIREKGLHYLIEALLRITGEWELVIVGDGPERESLENAISQLELVDRVDFQGWCSKEELTGYYNQCALVVIPSLWPEPFGRVGVEAAIHGRPAVAFDVGGVRAWLEDGVTGLLAKPADIEDLALCIQQLLDDPTKRRQLGFQAKETAFRRWHATEHVQTLLKHFTAAIIQQTAMTF